MRPSYSFLLALPISYLWPRGLAYFFLLGPCPPSHVSLPMQEISSGNPQRWTAAKASVHERRPTQRHVTCEEIVQPNAQHQRGRRTTEYVSIAVANGIWERIAPQKAAKVQEEVKTTKGAKLSTQKEAFRQI